MVKAAVHMIVLCWGKFVLEYFVKPFMACDTVCNVNDSCCLCGQGARSCSHLMITHMWLPCVISSLVIVVVVFICLITNIASSQKKDAQHRLCYLYLRHIVAQSTTLIKCHSSGVVFKCTTLFKSIRKICFCAFMLRQKL